MSTVHTSAREDHSKNTDKTVDFIRRKAYDRFIKELTSEGAADANRPDTKGRMPMVEAVRTKELRYVDALIQSSVYARTKDAATGASPLHLAFQQNLVEIARLLLAYGADVNVEDKTGKKAREFAPSAEIHRLITMFDANGSIAFEDAPGTWRREENSGKHAFWHNTHTSESRWNTPPSCAWSVQEDPDQTTYTNSVTGQRRLATPPGLCWRLLRVGGVATWYNWAGNSSQLEAPGELPPSTMAAARSMANVRWHNPVTGQYLWEDPAGRAPWRAVERSKPGDGPTHFYYHGQTGESTWEQPEELAWSTVTQGGEQSYYYNAVTGESSWDAPTHMQWQRHDTEL
ncbi:MAG: hypothetical protein WDW36_009663 [Sanguina aurantia]